MVLYTCKKCKMLAEVKVLTTYYKRLKKGQTDIRMQESKALDTIYIHAQLHTFSSTQSKIIYMYII